MKGTRMTFHPNLITTVPQLHARMAQSLELRHTVDNLARFSRHQLLSRDVDPLYPVLRVLEKDMDEEMALWHTLLYVAYYNVTSSHFAFNNYPKPGGAIPMDLDVASLPTGVERRGLRGGYNMQQHIYSLLGIWLAHGESWKSWLTYDFTDDPRENWKTLNITLQMPMYNGRWAAYKTAEILKTVHDFPVEPTDMGMAFSSGPRWGLSLLYGEVQGNGPVAVARLDRQAEDLHRLLIEDYNLGVTLAELETMLCDFHSLCEGKYYVGHDIDQMQEQIVRAYSTNDSQLPGELWQARQLALPHDYLGELNGWVGVDKARKGYYRTHHEVIVR
jgi:hypothetical protein